MKTLSIYTNEGDKIRIQTYAKQHNISVSALIRLAVLNKIIDNYSLNEARESQSINKCHHTTMAERR